MDLYDLVFKKFHSTFTEYAIIIKDYNTLCTYEKRLPINKIKNDLKLKGILVGEHVKNRYSLQEFFYFYMIDIENITQFLDRNNYLPENCDLENYEIIIPQIIDLWNTKKYVEIGYINEFLNDEEATEEIKQIINSYYHSN